MSERRLRVAHLIVQPVLVWDDGEELSPGPPCQPTQVSLSELAGVPERLLKELEAASAGVTSTVEGPLTNGG